MLVTEPKLVSAPGCEKSGAPPVIKSFVVPFADETFLSILSRYHALYESCSTTALLSHFLGGRGQCLHASIPSGLERFYQTAPIGLWRDFEDFLERHTLLPYYRPFLNPRAAGKLKRLPDRFDLTSKDLPLSAQGGKANTAPRFCPACMHGDVKTLGQPYWRRNHQIPGVLICHVHGVRLIDRCPHCGALSRHRAHLFLPRLKCECGYAFSDAAPSSAVPDIWQNRALSLARFCSGLLDAKLGPINPSLLLAFYRSTLHDRKYYQSARRSKLQLWLDLLGYYTPDFFEKIGLNAPAKVRPTWFARLTTHSIEYTRHPLHHALLLAFLFPKFKTFKDALAGFKAVGGIVKIKKERSRKKRKRSTANQKLIERMRKLLVDEGRTFGAVQRELCISRYQMGVLVRSSGILAQIRPREYLEKEAAMIRDLRAGLSCSEVSKKYATGRRRVEELCTSRPDLAKTRRALRKAAKLLEHKKRLEMIIVRNLYVDAMELRCQEPSSYVYVRCHDKTWLNQRLSKDVKQTHVSGGGNFLNLQKRDAEAESKIRTVSENLKNPLARPVYLTKNSLLVYAEMTTKVYPHLERLPGTRQALEELIDTDESFNRRKIAWAIRELSKAEIPVTKNAVMRQVSVSGKFDYLIDEALDMLAGEADVNRLQKQNVMI